MNGILDGSIPYEIFEEVVLHPLLTFMFESLLDKTVFANAEISWKDLTGPADVSWGVDAIHRQRRTLLVHCLRGINRTAIMVATLLIAFYHEVVLTKRDVEKVARYVCALRPCLEFFRGSADAMHPLDHFGDWGVGPAERCSRCVV